MKTIKVLLFLSLIFLASCSSDDNDEKDDFKLDSTYLKQTTWKGSIIQKMNDEIYNGAISILFTTDKDGSYEYKLNNYHIEALQEPFAYEVKDKLMEIRFVSPGISTHLAGDWIIESQNKNKLILTRDAHIEEGLSYKIELTRVD